MSGMIAANPEIALQEKQTQEAIEAALSKLPDRPRDVLERHLGWYGEPQTLRAIANRYGRSVERIRQLEAKALRILKHPSRSGPIRRASPMIHDYPHRPIVVRQPDPPPHFPTVHATTLVRCRGRLGPFPEYDLFLDRLWLEPRLREVGTWDYWDFVWPFEIGLSTTQAVDFAIDFNACKTLDEREALCAKMVLEARRD